jgi:hypothetical protein
MRAARLIAIDRRLALALDARGLAQAPCQQAIAARDPAAFDEFGFSAAVSGGSALVGAPGSDDACPSAGAAYFFERAADVWTQVKKVLPEPPFSGPTSIVGFGGSVAMSGGTAVVGAPPLLNGAGNLVPGGQGAAVYDLPPGTDPALAGATLHHAFAVVEVVPCLHVALVSAPAPLLLQP